MSRVSVSRPLGLNSDFMRDARRLGAAKTAAKLAAVAAEADRQFDAIVNDEFRTDNTRRRSPGTRRLAGSSRTSVEWDGDGFPVELVMTVLDPRQKDKVAALNYGSPPHEIRGNPKLVFPDPQSFARKRGGRRRNLVLDKVDHPGNPIAHRFMERAVERAVRAAYGAAVARRRK